MKLPDQGTPGAPNNGLLINLVVLVAALVAVLGAAIPGLNLLGDRSHAQQINRESRAHEDQKRLATALWQFHQTSGHWPNVGERQLLVMSSLSQPRPERALPTILYKAPSERVTVEGTGGGAPSGYLDPWGRPYVIRMGPLDGADAGGDKAVILSAGPNGVIDTPKVLSRDAHFAGDDVGVAFYLR